MWISGFAGTLLSLFYSVSADLTAADAPSGSGSADAGIYPPTLKPLISRANTLLSLGQFHEAAATYSEAIEQDPTSYTLYYKRGTAYFSLSRHSSALDDFAQVIKLTSDSFPHVHFMNAKIYTKEGRWTLAKKELDAYPRKQEEAVAELRKDIQEAEDAHMKAEKAMKSGLWTSCYESATEGLRIAGYSPTIRILRAECAFGAGDLDIAVGDLTRLTHITQSSTTSYMRIFRIAYFLLPPPMNPSQNAALTALKQCLNHDPDSKVCLPAHRLLKSLNRSFTKLEKLEAANNWVAVNALVVGPSQNFLQVFLDALALHTSDRSLLVDPANTPKSLPIPSPLTTSQRLATLYRAACKAHTQLGKSRSGKHYCEKLRGIRGFEEDETALLGIGDAMIKNEEYEEAARMLEKAFEDGERQSEPLQQMAHKARKLLKQSKAKDYYKVLGAPRDADAATIKKAYRKATLKAHPDKGGSEKMMADVNEAYEVLSNPELRARFDAGEDPNDPQQGQQWQHGGGFSGGHPFANFFQQGGGSSGFQFHFGH